MQPRQSRQASSALAYAAYLSEVLRSAILSVGHGQTEAALSLGYTRNKTL